LSTRAVVKDSHRNDTHGTLVPMEPIAILDPMRVDAKGHFVTN
jgi:hypothetical protein